MWNLLEYYRIYGDERILESLVKGADCIVAHRGKSPIPENIGIDIEQVLGAMAVLGQQVDQSEYIEYARYIADHLTLDIGRPAEWYNPSTEVDPAKVRSQYARKEHHLHTYLSAIHGIVDLAIITGEKKYLEKARRIFDEALPYVWVTGGMPENSCAYYEYNDETCQVVDWIELCLKLFNATGQGRYLDAAELSILNHLLFDQLSTSSFVCQRSVTRHHRRGDHGNRGRIADFCCTMSGAWSLGQIATQVVTRNENGFSVNLALDLDVVTARHENPVRISQKVQIQKSDIVQSIVVHNEDKYAFDVKVRLPYWSDKGSLKINESLQTRPVVNGFAHVPCLPASKTSIVLKLPMILKIIPPGKSMLTIDSETPSSSTKEKGLQYGPYVMMFNREMYPAVDGHHIAITIPIDADQHPSSDPSIPESWNTRGTIPLLLKAQTSTGTPICLTPCANLTMTPLAMDDPYVIRFSDIKIVQNAIKQES